MAVAVAYQGQLGTATGSGASLAVTATVAPVGSLVVVFVGANTGAGTVSGVADTGGNTWAVAKQQANGATNPNAAMYWTRVRNGTLGTVTVSFNATVPTSSAASVHCWTASGAPEGWGWQNDYSIGPSGSGVSTAANDFDQNIYAAGVKVSVLSAITTTATITNFNGGVPTTGFVERSRTVGGTITLWAIDNIGLTGTGLYAGATLSASVAWQMLGGAFFVGPIEVQHASANATAGGANPTLAVTLGAPTSAANILVAQCASNGGTDFTAPGWTSAGVSGGNRLVAVLYRVGDGGTSYTFTRTGGATGEGLDIVVWEFSGLDTANPVDLHVRTDSVGAQASPATIGSGTAAANTLQLGWFVLDGNTNSTYLSFNQGFVYNWPTGNGNAPTQFTDPTAKVTVYSFGRFATVSTAATPTVSGWAGSIIWTGAVITLNGATASPLAFAYPAPAWRRTHGSRGVTTAGWQWDASTVAAPVNANAVDAAGTGTANASTPSVAAGESAGAGTGAGNASTGTIAVTAQQAVGTGTAYPSVPSVAPVATQAAATGTAYAPGRGSTPSTATAAGTANASAPSVAPSNGQATGTGTGNVSTGDLRAAAGSASATGTAQAPAPSVAPVASQAAGTGTAYQPGRGSTPTTATGTGTANVSTPTVAPIPSQAAATGTANTSTSLVGASAASAAATGAANGSSPKVAPTAGQGSGTGAGNTSTGTLLVTAGAAAATGTASPGAPSVAPTASAASGSGTAYNPGRGSTAGAATGAGTANASTPTVAVAASSTTGTGTASNAAESEAIAAAQATTGFGTAYQPSLLVTPVAQAASGTGTANDATASTAPTTYANATSATGTGAASAATPNVAPVPTATTGFGTGTTSTPVESSTPTPAAGMGSASAAAASGGEPAGSASGSGSGTGAGTTVAPVAQSAAAAGTANDSTATQGVSVAAATATGAGTGNAATVSISVSAQAATGTGTANQSTVSGSANAYATTATATGAGLAATPRVAPVSTSGVGSGVGENGAVSTPGIAGFAPGSGVGFGASVSLSINAATATGTTTTNVPIAAVKATPQTAVGFGTAYPAVAGQLAIFCIVGSYTPHAHLDGCYSCAPFVVWGEYLPTIDIAGSVATTVDLDGEWDPTFGLLGEYGDCSEPPWPKLTHAHAGAAAGVGTALVSS